MIQKSAAWPPIQRQPAMLTRESSGKTNPKRRRTSSDSLSASKATPSPSRAVSEEDSSKPGTNGNNGVKRAKGTSSRNHRDKEHRDRQKDLAAQRAEAASKRNARSERRRGDGTSATTFVPKIEEVLLFQLCTADQTFCKILHHPHLPSRPRRVLDKFLMHHTKQTLPTRPLTAPTNQTITARLVVPQPAVGVLAAISTLEISL
jgi:hypothetical protein